MNVPATLETLEVFLMTAPAMSNVTVRPVRTDANYAAALRDINALMDARPGTPDGDRLDVPVTLVQAYETRRGTIPSIRSEQRTWWTLGGPCAISNRVLRGIVTSTSPDA